MALRQSVGDLACTLLSIVRTRLELFSLEASEQKVNLIAILGMAFGALLFLTLAVLVFSIAVALYFWPTDHRYLALGCLSLLYALLGVGLCCADRKCSGWGKRVSVRGDIGGGSNIKKKK